MDSCWITLPSLTNISQHTVSLVNTSVPNLSICRIQLIMIFFASRYYYSSSVQVWLLIVGSLILEVFDNRKPSSAAGLSLVSGIWNSWIKTSRNLEENSYVSYCSEHYLKCMRPAGKPYEQECVWLCLLLFGKIYIFNNQWQLLFSCIFLFNVRIC